MNKTGKTFGVILIISLLISCSAGERNRYENTGKNNAEDFDSFYLVFHMDTLFQKERILFPVAGESNDHPGNKDSSFTVSIKGQKRDFHVNKLWESAGWVCHRLPIDTLPFKKEEARDSTIVFERVYTPDAGFEAKRVFRRFENKWFLVYYGANFY